jgi:crotonobetainyl-CoA:carnitine CoA-transferase CaiB-like acyl-CoA transferase
LPVYRGAGASDIADDPRFADNTDMANLSALIAALEPNFNRYTTAEWLRVLESAGVPAGLVIHAHPQTRARNITEVEHPTAGSLKTIDLPIKFSAVPCEVGRPAPLQGEHSRGILADVASGPAEIDALIERGAGAQPAGATSAGNP